MKADHAEGYAAATVKNTAERLDRFYHWVWAEFDGYTVDITDDCVRPDLLPLQGPVLASEAAATVTVGRDSLAEYCGVLADAKTDDREECAEFAVLSDLPCWPCLRDSRIGLLDAD